MQPRPDYGYDTYKGTGKLTGKIALITGADSGKILQPAFCSHLVSPEHALRHACLYVW